MKRWVVTAAILLLGALNWAALHDILKGEPDVRAEWTVVALSAALLAVAFGRVFRRRGRVH